MSALENTYSRRRFLGFIGGLRLQSFKEMEAIQSFACEIRTYHRLASAQFVENDIFSYVNRGYSFLSVSDIAKHYLGEKQITGASNVMFTFDDGYQSHLYAFEAAEKLKQRLGKIPMMFAIMPQFDYQSMEQVNPWQQSYNNGGFDSYLTLSEIQQIVGAGYDLANHTIDHARLTQISPREAFDQLRIAAEKIEWIYDSVGKEKQWWHKAAVYPEGLYNLPVVEAARLAGSQVAFTTERRSVHHPNQRLNLGRIGRN